MAIDRFALAKELNTLRRLAAEKWAASPLPVGEAATKQLKADMQDGPDPARLGMGPLAGSQFE